jgi:tetratricopeptide (TPR) repeat protein
MPVLEECMTSTDTRSGTRSARSVDAVRGRRVRKAGPPQDPVASALLTTILVIIVLALVTVAYALLTGVFGTGAPRTMAEQKIVRAGAKIEAGSKAPADWMAYIIALTNDGQYRKAQQFIDRGTKELKQQDLFADMLFMQANLYLAQSQYDRAEETADAALKQIKDAYDAGVVSSKATSKPSPASAFGLSPNYWELLLLKAELYEKTGKSDMALKAYDEYLTGNPTAATVFTLRGAVKEKLKDTTGAESDYRKALAFIPQDAEALAGLSRIGAVR